MESAVTYEVIDHPSALRSALTHLTGVASLALDLEMENHYHHYGLHIALIQVSTPEPRNYIFDPLSGIDVRLLGALFTNRDIELIIHDAEFDKRACDQVYQWKLNCLFDTKVAAQLCGFRKFGLANLLKDLLNIQTDKKFQTYDWLKRPLRKEALDYAARDTASLHTLKTILTRRLTGLGRLDWAREEFLFLERAKNTETALPMHYRIKKSSLLSPRQLAILRSLAAFRDQIARRLNRPVHFVIRDSILLQLASSPPDNEKALRRVSGLHPILYRQEYVQGFMQALAEGQTAPAEEHPLRRKRAPTSPGYHQRLKAMQNWRRHSAVRLGLEPYLILSNDVLNWCARNPGEPLPVPMAAQIRNWQKELLWEDFQRKFMIPELKG